AEGMEKYCRALVSFINGNDDSSELFKSVVEEASIPSSYLNRSASIVKYIDAVTRLESGESKAIDDLVAVLNGNDPIINRKAGDYADYIEALNLYNEGKFYSASVIFKNLDILDSAEKAASCIQKRPGTGIVYRSGNSKAVTLVIYDTQDSRDLYVKIYDKNDNLAETIYIRDGGKGTAYLAAGSYRFALASGDGTKWYGTKETYGPDGIYQRLKVNNTNSEYYSLSSGSWQLKFNVTDGNVHSESTNYGDV
ncbi:MAG: hypothetical protein II712_03740, partial [Erysipelotrichaceae bacterium]|nr:hypothetical protein [Erysipelotrichaceae bacterium]